VLTAPIPTVAQVARRFGVSRRRVKRLENLIDSFIESDVRRLRVARAKKKTTTTRGR
jgi:AraC-like DNA-binding protein